MTQPSIREFLRAVRRRLRQRLVADGAGAWALGVLGGALVLVLLAGGLGPSSIWRPIGALGLCGALGAAAWLAARAAQAFRSDEAVARFVGEAAPQVGDDLLSAVELERERERLDRQAVSRALIEALEHGVASRLGAVEPGRLVDLRPTRRRAAIGLAAVAAGWALAFALFPGALRRGWAELSIAREDFAQTSAEPIVADIRFVLKYPAYTKLPERVIAGSSGQILAMPGTEVSVSARALVPTRAARLELEADGVRLEPIDARVEGGVVSARFVVRKPGTWRFVLDGPRRLKEPEAHRIDLEFDRPPRVDLYAPADHLEVTGPRRIELAYSLDDDFGLGAVELVWRTGDGPPQRKAIAAVKPGERAATGKLEWDLAELELKPGTRITYHLEAKDNDDVLGPNVGRSRVYYLTVFSLREKREAAMAEQERLLELALGVLADRLETPKDGPDGEILGAYDKVHARAEALLQALARAQRALADDKQAQDGLRRDLRDMQARLGKLTHDEEELLADARDKRRRGLKLGPPRAALEAQHPKQVAELERDVLLLDDLLDKQRLEELLAVGDEMKAARDRLKSLLAKYRQTRSEALRKDIERELRELERRLAELQQKAAKLAQELPDEFLNAEAMGRNDLKSELDKIRELLARGEVDKALQELERMSSSLDRMMASMEGDLQGFRRDRFSAEERALQELENKVTDLQHDEQQLKGETDAIRERARAEAQRRLKDRVAPLQKQAREQVAQLKKQLENVEPRALSPYDKEELSRVKQRVEDLDRMLQAADLEEARGMARQAEAGLDGIAQDLREEEQRGWRGVRPQAKKARERVEESGRLAGKIASEIERAMPRPQDLMGPEDQKRMGELAQRQAALKRRAQELERELGRKVGPDGRPVPTPPRLGEGLRQAGQHMERAEGKLKRRDARDASGEEAQALEQLRQVKEQLQRERRPRDQMAGGRLDKEPVKIPGADEYRAPKEFRQDILDAMKRAPPAEYREQVKRYYEELVK